MESSDTEKCLLFPPCAFELNAHTGHLCQVPSETDIMYAGVHVFYSLVLSPYKNNTHPDMPEVEMFLTVTSLYRLD